MTSRRIGIVWNPVKTSRQELERAMERAVASSSDLDVSDIETVWFETTEDDAGQSAAEAAIDDGADLIVVAGGDGTVRAVAERLGDAGSDIPLGIVPLGTGNLLARNLGVPLGSVKAAFERALTSPPRPIDLGWLDVELEGETKRYAFAVMAGFGLDAHMITETDTDLKDTAGWLAYVESLGRAIDATDTLDVRVGIDGGWRGEDRVHTLLVGNCGTLQGGVNLLPDADPRDGELDLLMLRASDAAGWADTLRNMIWDNGIRRFATGSSTAESSKTTEHARLRSLDLELSEPRVVEIDGEDLGETTRFRVTVQENAVRVL